MLPDFQTPLTCIDLRFLIMVLPPSQNAEIVSDLDIKSFFLSIRILFFRVRETMLIFIFQSSFRLNICICILVVIIDNFSCIIFYFDFSGD